MADRPDDAAQEDSAEETVVVDREAMAETVVVERPVGTDPTDPEAAEETLLVDRADRTVVVDRGSVADGTLAVTRERAAPSGSSLPAGRRRRGMTMPPVAPGFGRGAIDAVGPGAVTTYEPREIPEPPTPPAAVEGVAATRAEAPGMPSVARRARRGGLIALVAFAGACVVSVVGLIALGVAVFG